MTKPEGCKCQGPFERRDPMRWCWGGGTSWFVSVKDCPLHGFEGPEPWEIRPRAQTKRQKDPKPFSQFYT